MRKTMALAIVAGVVGALIGLSVVPVVLWAQSGGCWGSICQSANGLVTLNAPVQASQMISLSTSPSSFLIPLGSFGFAKASAPPQAPGSGTGYLVMRSVGPGACQLFAAAGTSAIEVPIGPPFGGGC